MNCYGTLTELATRLGVSGTTHDALLLDLIEAASRWIDQQCGRHFYVVSAARALDVDDALVLFPPPHPDLLTASAVGVDNDGDGEFDDEAWTASDYLLYSGERATDGYPKRWLRAAPNGNYTLPRGRQVMQITGAWGYGDGRRADPTDSVGTLAAAVADGETTTATMAVGHGVAAGMTLRVDSEQMFVSAVSTNTLTVERGVNGTTAAAHESGASVVAYAYPAGIVNYTYCLAGSWYREIGSNGQYESERLGDYSYKRAAPESLAAMESRVLGPYAIA